MPPEDLIRVWEVRCGDDELLWCNEPAQVTELVVEYLKTLETDETISIKATEMAQSVYDSLSDA